MDSGMTEMASHPTHSPTTHPPRSASVHLVPVLKKGRRERGIEPGWPRIRGGGGPKMTERQTDQQVNNGGQAAGSGSEDKMDRGEGNQARGEMEDDERDTENHERERGQAAEARLRETIGRVSEREWCVGS